MGNIETFTIGFTEKSAESFFTKLKKAGVRRIIDVRKNNTSQLAGFSKRDDLKFFLGLFKIVHVQVPELVPTKEILDPYKKHNGDWNVYRRKFLELLAQRKIEDSVPKDLFAGGCLLCSEHLPTHCHRNLIVEYLAQHWKIRATHLT